MNTFKVPSSYYYLYCFLSQLICFIAAMEYVGPEKRVVAAATMSTCIALGSVLKGFLAWTGPSWRHLVLIVNAPFFTIFLYWWMAPESFRWLMSKGRYKDAKKLLKEAAETNGNVLCDNTLRCISIQNKETTKKDDSEPCLVVLVFKHKIILLRCLLTPMLWTTTLFIFYGLMMSSVGISGNKFLNFSAVAAAGIPGYWTAALLLNKIGRKPSLIAAYWICGTCQIAYILMPDGKPWLHI